MADHYVFAEINSTDKAGVIWVASILSLLYSFSTLITRILIKYHTLGLDDYAILSGTIVALAQYIAVFVSLNNGLGSSSLIQSEDVIKDLGTGVLVSEILFILAVALTKLSVVLFIKRLLVVDIKRSLWATNIALGLTVVWTIASILAVSVGCDATNTVYEPDTCVGTTVRWGAVIGTDALLEVIYVALVIGFVGPLQMGVYIKCTVVAAFAFRLPCVILSSLHGVAINRYMESDDHGLAIANRLLWQQVVLGYALVSATIPTLKSFIRGYNKAIGRGNSSSRTPRLGGGYGLDSYGRSNVDSGLEMRSMPRKSAPRSQTGDIADKIKLRPKDGQQYRADAFVNTDRVDKSARRASGGSNGSQDPIIRRDISIAVEYENVPRK